MVKYFYSLSVPLQVDNLQEEAASATISTVTAFWTNPGGVVGSYSVVCSNGTTDTPSVPYNDASTYTATCKELYAPGDTYTIYVTSESGVKSGAVANVQATACEYIILVSGWT